MLKQQLQQRLQQKLSPQQLLVIKLLGLTSLELEEAVKQELLENPILEEGAEDTPATNDDEPEIIEEEGENEDILLGDYSNEDEIPDYKLQEMDRTRLEKREEIPFSGSNSLHEFLLAQLRLRDLDEKEQKIAEYIVYSIDDDGYLRRELAAVADDLLFQADIDVSVAKLEEILREVQALEPAGIGARDLRESLLIQLDHRDETPQISMAKEVLMLCFDDFIKKHYEKVARQLKITTAQLKCAITEITTLNPKPAGGWTDANDTMGDGVIPDFVVENIDNELFLSLNNANVPQLRINKEYTRLLNEYVGNRANQHNEKRDALLFVKQKLDAAQWFIDSIKQRQQTLLKTMEVIVELQHDFFITGDISSLRPMILKDVADRTGYDISTISRAANSKYVETNLGIYALKFLFSESIQNDQGEEISTREVKSTLKKIVDAEDKIHPLSDDSLCEMLNEQGYQIARRTIAKYREQLSIPVARLRKEL